MLTCPVPFWNVWSGAVAQLVARLVRNEKVRGSIPLSSTNGIAHGREVAQMKTMTCRQMGGPCELAFQAHTADEAIKAEDKHLKEMVASGDETHKSALDAMRGRWKNPIAGMGWYKKTKKAFAALPEDK